MKTYKIVFILLGAIAFQSYTLYDGNPALPFKRPVLELRYSTSQVSSQILEPMKAWFLKTSGTVGFEAKESEEPIYSGMEDLDCNQPYQTNGTDTVSIEMRTTPDPDCTADVCTIVVTCDSGDIIKTGIVLNQSSLDTYKNESEKFWLHELGHLLGLSHPAAGDKVTDCNSEKDSGCNPPKNTIMYRFFADRSGTIAQDEKDGIVALYGQNTLPLPVSGEYAITSDETQVILAYNKFSSIAGLDDADARAEMNENLVEHVAFDEHFSGKPFSQRIDEYFARIERQTETFTADQLKMQLRMIVMGIMAGDSFVQDIQSGRFKLNPEYVTRTLTKQKAIRNRTIERLRELGELE